jgi:DNA-binding transcriptional LysR family regulator
MDIELLKTFLAVKDFRHFGRAADNLHLTQAAVSARVKQIEEYLGVPLFIRNRNNIQLTDEGERLVPYAEKILQTWNKARGDVSLKHEQKQQLSIGATSGLWNYTFQYRLPSLGKQLPNLAISAVSGNADDILQLIEGRSIDIGILFDAPNISDLTIYPAGKLKLILASSIENISVSSALKDNYIYVDWGKAFDSFHTNKFGDHNSPILSTSLATIALSYMENQPASSYIPMQMVNNTVLNHIHAVEGAPAFSRQISLVYKTNSKHIDLIKQVIPLLTAEV